MRKHFRLVAVALSLFCAVCLRSSDKKPQPLVVEDFDFEGTALFQCECTAYACPCQENGAPNHGTCEAADFVHIASGRYGKLRLDGLNASATWSWLNDPYAKGAFMLVRPGEFRTILPNVATPEGSHSLCRGAHFALVGLDPGCTRIRTTDSTRSDYSIPMIEFESWPPEITGIMVRLV